MGLNENSVFERIGEIASEEVVTELVIKSVNQFYFTARRRALNASAAKSFDFIINRFLMKLFEQTTSISLKTVAITLNLLYL